MSRIVRTLSITALLMLAVACSSDAVPATSVPATSAPYVPPTSQPSLKELPPDSLAIGDLDDPREIPESLRDDSITLANDEAVSTWTQFLSETNVAPDDLAWIITLCGNHTGKAIGYPAGYFRLEGEESLTWTLMPDRGGRPENVILAVEYDDPTLKADIRFPLRVEDGQPNFGGHTPLIVAESEDC